MVCANWLVASSNCSTWMTAFSGSMHPVVDHGVDLDRDVVLGDHVLRRHVEHARPQVHAHDLLDEGNDQDQARPLHLPEAAEQEHDAALVLAQDADRVGDEQDDENKGKQPREQCWHVFLLEFRCSVRRRASGRCGRRRAPADPWRVLAPDFAAQISPCTWMRPSAVVPVYHLADAADHLLGAGAHRPQPRAGGKSQNAEKERGAGGRQAGDHLPGDLDRDVRLVGIEQEQRAEGERDDAADPQRCRSSAGTPPPPSGRCRAGAAPGPRS